MSEVTVLPDGSAFFTMEVDTSASPPENPIFWNCYNKVVQDHRNGNIDIELTNIERQKRGLPTPWTPEMCDVECHEPPVY